MGKVRTGLAVSLDGFISGPNDGPEAPMGDGGERLLAWYGGGDTEYRLPGPTWSSRSRPDRRLPPPDPRNHRGVGVRPEDLRPHPWVGRQPPLGDAGLVVNSSVPPAWVYQGSPFRFVTDGLESALAQA